jgi:hypothetical protein
MAAKDAIAREKNTIQNGHESKRYKSQDSSIRLPTDKTAAIAIITAFFHPVDQRAATVSNTPMKYGTTFPRSFFSTLS